MGSSVRVLYDRFIEYKVIPRFKDDLIQSCITTKNTAPGFLHKWVALVLNKYKVLG
jgi:hypothetical protein